MTSWVERWHDGHWLFRLLLPLGWLFRRITAVRRAAYLSGRRQAWRAPVPVIVVGNISAGGTGKTPLTLALVEQLRAAGWQPGIVSRGYGGKTAYPCRVTPDASPTAVGDEPLLLARRAGVPVVVDPRRARGARMLLADTPCNLIICDDGLQHYALARDIEIAVIDGRRGLGSGLPLPAGPLREPVTRLGEVDFCVINGDDVMGVGTMLRRLLGRESHAMQLQPDDWQALGRTGRRPLSGLVHAVAGIGHPPRFFDQLTAQGYKVVPHPFPDHHAYRAADLMFRPALPLVMTEKDAVKCADIAPDNSWYVPVRASLPDSFWQALRMRLAAWRPANA